MLKPGNYGNLSGSMAQAIETEFNTLWRSRHGEELPDNGKEDRQLLFIAIARGVLRHLDEQASSITVTYPDYGTRSVDIAVRY